MDSTTPKDDDIVTNEWGTMTHKEWRERMEATSTESATITIEGKAAPERFRKLVYHICDTICTDGWSPQEFQNMGHFDNFYERFLKEYQSQDEAVE